MTQQPLRDRAAGRDPEPGQEVQRREAPPVSIGMFLTELRPEMQRALPKGLDADRMARIALTAIRRNPDLAKCTRESFAGALLTASALGLEVGLSGEAHLVPYEHRRGPLKDTFECQLIVGYQGLVALWWRSPLAHTLDCQAVHEHDQFDFAYGSAPFLRHRPARGNRGKVTDYYAVATLTTGGSAFVVLSPDEVRALRGGKVGPSGSIPDPQRWLERKTALKQLLKTLPRSVALSTALQVDESTGAALYADRVSDRELDASPAAQVTAGPAVSPEEPPADDGQEPWTPPVRSAEQSTALHAAFGSLGIVDRDEKLRYMSDHLGHRVDTSKTLTTVEASQLLEALAHEDQEPPGRGVGP